MNERKEKIKVFFDYTCPWVRQANYWLIDLEREADFLEIEWKPFLLEQVNAENKEIWKAWDQDFNTYTSRGIWPHLGGIAARSVSKEAGYQYMHKLLELKHVEHKDVRSREFIYKLCEELGFFTSKFQEQINSDVSLKIIADSHEEGESKGIFGTPTIEFSDGNTVFLKTFTPPKSDSKKFFESLKNIVFNNTYFGELKKPQPPWPRQHSI